MALNTKLKPLTDTINKLASNVFRLDERQKVIFFALLSMRGLHYLKMDLEEENDQEISKFMEGPFDDVWSIVEEVIEGLPNFDVPKLAKDGEAVVNFLNSKLSVIGPAASVAPLAMMLCISLCQGNKIPKKAIETALQISTVGVRSAFDSMANQMQEEDLLEMQNFIEIEYNIYLKIFDSVSEFCPKNYSGMLDLDEFHKLCADIVDDLYEDEVELEDDDEPQEVTAK